MSEVARDGRILEVARSRCDHLRYIRRDGYLHGCSGEESARQRRRIVTPDEAERIVDEIIKEGSMVRPKTKIAFWALVAVALMFVARAAVG